MDTQQRKAIKNLVSTLRLVREHHGDIPVQMLETLLVAALSKDASQNDIQKETTQSKASASRNIRAWTNWTRHHVPGPAYLETIADPYEQRRKLVKLTPQGMKYVEKLAKSLTK